MKELTRYLLPVVILFFLFYLTAVLIESTFNIWNMDRDFRIGMFLTWLGLSIAQAMIKGMESK